MKRTYKILISLLIVIIGIFLYFYTKPPFSVKNEKALNLKYKIKPYQDSVVVFIPYTITIANNRLEMLRFNSILDEKVTAGDDVMQNLIYNNDGIELTDFEEKSKEKFESDYFKIKYRKTIFPFKNKIFYYYKSHTLYKQTRSQNIDLQEINAQLINLKNNINFQIHQKVIDSLYGADNQERFNINFTDNDNRFMPKYIKAKINSNKQIPVKIIDSLRNMNKDEAKKYLLKVAGTDIRENLNDF